MSMNSLLLLQSNYLIPIAKTFIQKSHILSVGCENIFTIPFASRIKVKGKQWQVAQNGTLNQSYREKFDQNDPEIVALTALLSVVNPTGKNMLHWLPKVISVKKIDAH